MRWSDNIWENLAEHSRKVFYALLVTVSLVGHQTYAGQQKPGPNVGKTHIILSSQESGGDSQDVFPCTGRIHVQLIFPDGFVGKHLIEGFWFKPDGTLQERTKVPVDIPAVGDKTARFWLQFKDEQKSIVDDFILGGDYGARQSIFNGVWTLQIISDEMLLTQTSFRVSCI